jgi:Zn-finger nucleic acid-binding protein
MRKERAEVVRCPQCKVPMKPVTARANPGSLIELDQCGQCGGIWCDKWELFPIQADESARLEPADQELLRVPLASVKKELFCSRCTARMSAINEPSLGADVQFQRCLKCDAIWLNRGQFTRYKNHQKSSQQKFGCQDNRQEATRNRRRRKILGGHRHQRDVRIPRGRRNHQNRR